MAEKNTLQNPQQCESEMSAEDLKMKTLLAQVAHVSEETYRKELRARVAELQIERENVIKMVAQRKQQQKSEVERENEKIQSEIDELKENLSKAWGTIGQLKCELELKSAEINSLKKSKTGPVDPDSCGCARRCSVLMSWKNQGFIVISPKIAAGIFQAERLKKTFSREECLKFAKSTQPDFFDKAKAIVTFSSSCKEMLSHVKRFPTWKKAAELFLQQAREHLEKLEIKEAKRIIIAPRFKNAGIMTPADVKVFYAQEGDIDQVIGKIKDKRYSDLLLFVETKNCESYYENLRKILEKRNSAHSYVLPLPTNCKVNELPKINQLFAKLKINKKVHIVKPTDVADELINIPQVSFYDREQNLLNAYLERMLRTVDFRYLDGFVNFRTFPCF